VPYISEKTKGTQGKPRGRIKPQAEIEWLGTACAAQPWKATPCDKTLGEPFPVTRSVAWKLLR